MMNASGDAARVLVADRHEIFRRGVVGILQQARPDWSFRQAATLAALAGALIGEPVDLLLLDIDLPGLGGSAGISQLRACIPNCAIVILGDSEHRDLVLQCLAAGAFGYVCRGANPALLLGAVETVLSGAVFAPASLAGSPGSALSDACSQRPHTAIPNFTGRQCDVLQLLVEGCATKTIARRLDLAVGTVKVHLGAIYRQLGVNSRLEALVRLRDFHNHVTQDAMASGAVAIPAG